MITIRPVYECKRPSRAQLWGVYVGAELVLITRVYPGWAI